MKGEGNNSTDSPPLDSGELGAQSESETADTETADSPGPKLVLMQCTSSYPCRPQDVNLQVLKTYSREFPKVTIGYSGKLF